MKNSTPVRSILICVTLLLSFASITAAETILVEAEAFTNHGGWVLDQQFMDQMGSPFLLAHGLGKPVSDAVTSVTFPVAGTYRVWVRTRDWVAPWKAPGAPGRFQVLVNGMPLNAIFGTEGADWHWQQGGAIIVTNLQIAVSLHDLTGFEGRCDAIIFTTDTNFVPPNAGEQMAAFRSQMLGLSSQPKDAGNFDLVVVGGGMSGSCAAVSAARLGLQVALIQNRPVLGGNNSSEVRVHLGGEINLPPYPAIGNVVRELDSGHQGNARPAQFYDDNRKMSLVQAEENIHLFVNMHAFKVQKQGDRIVAVIAKHIINGSEFSFRAPLFVDCTGDGTLGYLAGAEYRMGRESKEQTGESMAPEKPDKMTMGASVMWYSAQSNQPTIFPDCPWALQFTEESCQQATRGDWNWEAGLSRDQITEFEYIRDHSFRAIYGNWAFQKNHSRNKDKYAKLKLDWVAYIGGKRESRRLLGDVILQQQDIQKRNRFPDAFVTSTWSIDLHYPDPENTKYFPGEEFRTICTQPKIKPYPIPYRCLYSRNIQNLMMAGRCISVTHVALGTVRVMRTCGMMGELVGMAASLCKKYNTNPRGVYQDHLSRLTQLAKQGVGKVNETNDKAFGLAAENGKLANEGFIRCQNFVRGWLQQADPRSRLIPRNLDRDRDIWNAEDSAADNYPFMVLTAAITNPALFKGRMMEMLRAETILTSRIDRLPDTYSFSKQDFFFKKPDIARIIFGSSEYVKDGLLPLTEWLGPSPWSERMINILDDMWMHAPEQTNYGNIVSRSQETNGEMLQVLSRIYWMTGDSKYLYWAMRLGDYYLLGNHHPTRDETIIKLRDHGCEIISGLCELYATVSFAMPARKNAYQKSIHVMLDNVLQVGRNQHGMFYNSANTKTGRHDQGLADTWGYNLNGFYTVYLIDNTEAYRLAVRTALINLNNYYNYHRYNWGGSDDYADSIESAINLYNRELVPSVADWMDSEIKIMWSMQKSSGIIEGWHGDGNFARTTIMYCLWKTKGLTIEPWSNDVIFGAVLDGDALKISISSRRGYTGKIIFDSPRHKTIMKMPLDWPRINQFPEWFTAKAENRYAVHDLAFNSKKVYTGAQLQQGLPINLHSGITRNFMVETSATQ
ncbi:MAG: FAD-dependent oxidoreductase [Planctomycetes bacterium]|nr:FAD-dependent oxidoreductase [Planctomycetota bacterium]MBL7143202.1 FAD-dependent oxidoreductase [Phycisphaerae bacterium]